MIELLNTNSTPKQVLRRDYNPVLIFQLYQSDLDVGYTTLSPLREDKHPSFTLFVHNTKDEVYYKDWSTGDSGDLFRFVRKWYLYNKQIILDRDYNIYTQIQEDIKKGGLDKLDKKARLSLTKSIKKVREKQKNTTKIQIVADRYTKEQLDWWKSFGISKATLDEYLVLPVKYLYINDMIRASVSKDNPIYAYQIGKYYKIYQPLNTKYKWRNNYPSFYVEGMVQLLERLERRDILFITKSLKDVMVLHELGFDSVAGKSESSMILEKQLNILRGQYPDTKIYLLMDNDEAGVRASNKYHRQYGFKQIFLPKQKAKDISDYVRDYGKSEAYTFLKNAILS